MYLSNNEAEDKTETENSSQTRQPYIPIVNSNSSSSSSPLASPSRPTLLVIDDNSSSGDSMTPNTNDILTKPMTSTSHNKTGHIQIPTTLPSFVTDMLNATPDQQRRRNSSIAKLLGGQPLNNQQYEEINQQILDAQSTHHVINSNDHGSDASIRRTRSSITRTLLMNTERNNTINEPLTKPQLASNSSIPKNFDYLIGQEPEKFDIEHVPTSIQRANSLPKASQNLSAASRINAQLANQSRSKRKRSISKTLSLTPNQSTTNIPPFSLHNPFELEPSPTHSAPSMHQSQNEFHRFNLPKRPHHSDQQSHSLAMNNSTSSQRLHTLDKAEKNSSIYDQFSIYQDRSPSNYNSNCPGAHKSTSLSPVTALFSAKNERLNSSNPTMSSMRKTKAATAETNLYDFSTEQSYYDASDPSESMSTTPSEPTAPLKKRLLHAYINEKHPA